MTPTKAVYATALRQKYVCAACGKPWRPTPHSALGQCTSRALSELQWRQIAGHWRLVHWRCEDWADWVPSPDDRWAPPLDRVEAKALFSAR